MHGDIQSSSLNLISFDLFHFLSPFLFFTARAKRCAGIMDAHAANTPLRKCWMKALREQGIDYVLEHYMGLKPDEPLYAMIKG